jgi:hypothetical protein
MVWRDECQNVISRISGGILSDSGQFEVHRMGFERFDTSLFDEEALQLLIDSDFR